MQEKESIMVVRRELKVLSLGLTVRLSQCQTVTLVMTEFSFCTSQPLNIVIIWEYRPLCLVPVCHAPAQYYRKFPTYSDTQKICCNRSKI